MLSLLPVSVFFAFVASVSALPSPTINARSPQYFWEHGSRSSSSFLGFVGKRGTETSDCDLSQATMPVGTPPYSYPLSLARTNMSHSTSTPTTPISRPHPLPRSNRARHPELHLRPKQQHRDSCCGRRPRLPLQRLLHRRHPIRPTRTHPLHRPQLPRPIIIRYQFARQHRSQRSPLLPQRHDAVLQSRHRRAQFRPRQLQESQYLCRTD